MAYAPFVIHPLGCENPLEDITRGDSRTRVSPGFDRLMKKSLQLPADHPADPPTDPSNPTQIFPADSRRAASVS
jgi:hypothetical protein